jgi:uncharacterized coiled-coil protein SlyX
MNAYDLTELVQLQREELNKRAERIAELEGEVKLLRETIENCYDVIDQRGLKIEVLEEERAELEKQYDAMVMSFEARLATRGYEIQIKDQADRIAELEKQVDELWDYKISYENLDGGKN